MCYFYFEINVKEEQYNIKQNKYFIKLLIIIKSLLKELSLKRIFFVYPINTTNYYIAAHE